MKVLYITNLINSGGVAKVVMNYITGCCAQNEEFECDVVAYEEPDTKTKDILRQHNVSYYCVPRPTRNIFNYYFKIRQILIKGHYDAVHTHIEYFNWIPCRIAKKNGVTTTVSHAHGQKGKSENFINQLIEKIGRRNNAKYCDIRLSCSEPSGKYVFGADFELVPNCIDTNTISSIDNESCNAYNQEFNIKKGANTIFGYMGYLGYQKNPRLAVETIKIIYDINPGAVLLIAGDGVEKENIQKYIDENMMSDYVFLIGQRSDNLMLMQYFDYLIMPSFSEGMSIALIEAQVSGTPCIVSPGVPQNNDLHMGLFYQAARFTPEDFMAQYKKAVKTLNNLSFEERLDILRLYKNDKESVIYRLLTFYRGG